MALLSVLDQSPIRSGGTAMNAIRETLELAQAADRLGYHRYWLAEHHSTRGLAGSSPEILIGQVAARTTRIRVGSGGVMLSHYSPLADQFRPSPHLAAPQASLAVFVVCADTEAEALRLARSRDLFLIWLRAGRSLPYPSVEEAEGYPYSVRERALVEHNRRRSIAGTPEQVRDCLVAMGAACHVDEFVVVTITHDFKARLRSYELLAEVFGLDGQGAAG
jgi:alkanesulfonate monooxygenase SsuD/methylene tetrahydromethanopterin reductase-like flavin-dependent oxidoreductase (luciferase family)